MEGLEFSGAVRSLRQWDALMGVKQLDRMGIDVGAKVKFDARKIVACIPARCFGD